MPGTYSTTQVHGYLGSMKIGNVTLWIKEWSGEHKNEAKEGTTTQNNGFKSWTKGIESMSGTFTAIWDTSQSPYVIGIAPGTTAALQLNITPTSYYSLNAMLMNVNPKHDVENLVTYTVNFESQGQITPPTS